MTTTLVSQPNTFPQTPIPIPNSTSHLRQLHAKILRSGDPTAAPITLLRLALKSHSLSPNHYLSLFQSLPSPPDPTLSNNLLRHLSRLGLPGADPALRVYTKMRWDGSPVARFSFPAVLAVAAKSRALTQGREVHGVSLKLGFGDDSFVEAGLVRMYSGCGRIQDARLVFDKMSHRDNVAWGVMIDGYSRCGVYDEVFRLYEEMRGSETEPDEIILSTVLSACGRARNLSVGKAIHGVILSADLSRDSRLVSALVGMYASCGSMDAARELFDAMPLKNLVVSTAMISGYSKLGLVEEARSVFDQTAEKDLFLWSAMISGYAESNQPRESLKLFDEMQLSGTRPDKITMLSVVSTCARLGILDEAEKIHAYIDRNVFRRDLPINNAMIDMYAKCGSLERAREIFEKMQTKNVITWTSMINASAIHGDAVSALALFDRMKIEKVKPNGVTFVGILYACSHAGLVEEGRKIFTLMTDKYKIKPKHEHYGCLVDLFGRANLLREALGVVESMPVAPNVAIWGSLMAACQVHGESELGEFAAKRLLEIEPNHDGALVVLSNIYAKEQRWEKVSEVRNSIKRSGVLKERGFSRIGDHEFLMADRSHKQTDEIYENLEKMVSELKLVGYTPNTRCVLVDLDEEAKAEMILWHSEKLALSFGLISQNKDRCFRIVKNLRICEDCHTFMKLCSKEYGKEIVVRDRTRFHHFKEGLCTCKDYW